MLWLNASPSYYCFAAFEEKIKKKKEKVKRKKILEDTYAQALSI
jgi:hypothetical protein